MKNHEFSVCITTYNSESYITRTLDNVAAQTYKNFEIVLVDDGSK
ncbi:MAG: glycosyltransferase, partial [Lachnospiraceae bacterium]|nr:glycosyltransferase [Lachnospiraceae bacterium]